MFSANSSQVSEDRLYVEDVFSTYLYTGNGSTQTITNGINLSGKDGLVWIKCRSLAGENNTLLSKMPGSGSHYYWMFSDGTGGASPSNSSDTYFLQQSTGFRVGPDPFSQINGNGQTFASWTFRKAPKFFDVVTYTGNGSAARAISHSLGIAPGSMFIKRTDSTGQWVVYHRSLGNANALVLESTSAQFSTNTFGYTTPDATTFTVGDYNNINGATYVAYLFAHDATSDGIIQCGSYTGTGSDLTVNLGWEPQWLLIKNATTAGWSWNILDNMRGIAAGADPFLRANLSDAEVTTTQISLAPTGFTFSGTGNGGFNGSGSTYIYIAIRRGPMRTPTSGTSVFSPDFFGGGTVYYNSGFPTDLALTAYRPGDTYNTSVADRLRGGNNTLVTSSTAAEIADTTNYFDNNVGFGLAYTGGTNSNYIGWLFRRAPSFFDVVCYTGTGSARTINHNLGVAPELMIVKIRNFSNDWRVYYNPNSSMYLNTNQAGGTAGSGIWNNTDPTATVFSVGNDSSVNGSGGTYVAYLFASCPGVSKVGSYTGNGSSQTINCGFAAGARFVMIKRTDSTGDWYVWDTARGIVAGNDPYLRLNSTAAEVTTNDSVDTDSSGFVVNQLSATNINVSSATYLYLAVA